MVAGVPIWRFFLELLLCANVAQMGRIPRSYFRGNSTVSAK